MFVENIYISDVGFRSNSVIFQVNGKYILDNIIFPGGKASIEKKLISESIIHLSDIIIDDLGSKIVFLIWEECSEKCKSKKMLENPDEPITKEKLAIAIQEDRNGILQILNQKDLPLKMQHYLSAIVEDKFETKDKSETKEISEDKSTLIPEISEDKSALIPEITDKSQLEEKDFRYKCIVKFPTENITSFVRFPVIRNLRDMSKKNRKLLKEIDMCYSQSEDVRNMPLDRDLFLSLKRAAYEKSLLGDKEADFNMLLNIDNIEVIRNMYRTNILVGKIVNTPRFLTEYFNKHFLVMIEKQLEQCILFTKRHGIDFSFSCKDLILDVTNNCTTKHVIYMDYIIDATNLIFLLEYNHNSMKKALEKNYRNLFVFLALMITSNMNFLSNEDIKAVFDFGNVCLLSYLAEIHSKFRIALTGPIDILVDAPIEMLIFVSKFQEGTAHVVDYVFKIIKNDYFVRLNNRHLSTVELSQIEDSKSGTRSQVETQDFKRGILVFNQDPEKKSQIENQTVVQKLFSIFTLFPLINIRDTIVTSNLIRCLNIDIIKFLHNKNIVFGSKDFYKIYNHSLASGNLELVEYLEKIYKVKIKVTKEMLLTIFSCDNVNLVKKFLQLPYEKDSSNRDESIDSLNRDESIDSLNPEETNFFHLTLNEKIRESYMEIYYTEQFYNLKFQLAQKGNRYEISESFDGNSVKIKISTLLKYLFYIIPDRYKRSEMERIPRGYTNVLKFFLIEMGLHVYCNSRMLHDLINYQNIDIIKLIIENPILNNILDPNSGDKNGLFVLYQLKNKPIGGRITPINFKPSPTNKELQEIFNVLETKYNKITYRLTPWK